MKTGEVSLEEVINFFNGKAPPKSMQGEFPVYGSNGQIGWTNEFNHSAGVIIGRVGANCGSVEICKGKFWASDNTIVVKPKNENNLTYWYYRLSSMPLRSYAGGAAQPLLTQGILKVIRTRVAHQRIQPVIASILSSYDDLIENNRRRIQLLEQAARLLYKEWFVHLRFPGHEHTKVINGVPEGWKRNTFSHWFSFHGGFAFKSKTYRPEGKFKIVTIKNVHNAQFIPECPSKLDYVPQKMKKHCDLVTGDILLSLTGNVGRACIVFGKNYLLNQRVAKVVGNTGISPSFTYWTFSNEKIQKELENLAYGVAQLNLSTVKLCEHEFLKPSSTLIELFGEIADPMFWQITKLNLEVAQLRKARDLLLTRLLSGELAV